MDFLENFKENLENSVKWDLKWLEEEFKILFQEHDSENNSRENLLAKRILEVFVDNMCIKNDQRILDLLDETIRKIDTEFPGVFI
ncbi:MAG: hypothetical protein KGD63_03835 [Candidatus Lokiarchaeota archaeon]|nr:hypothetical protein [Candidatus Lokiarchaeota archaeon]